METAVQVSSAADLGRRVGLVFVVQAELAVAVVAPAPERAVALDGQGVVWPAETAVQVVPGPTWSGDFFSAVLPRPSWP